MTHDLRLHLRLSVTAGQARALLAALLLAVLPIELGSETLTLITAYPAPAGVYNALITVGNGPTDTTLNRDGGNTILVPPTNATGRVGIGTSSPSAGIRLDVVGRAAISEYLLLPEVRLSLDTTVTADGICSHNGAVRANGIGRVFSCVSGQWQLPGRFGWANWASACRQLSGEASGTFTLACDPGEYLVDVWCSDAGNWPDCTVNPARLGGSVTALSSGFHRAGILCCW